MVLRVDLEVVLGLHFEGFTCCFSVAVKERKGKVFWVDIRVFQRRRRAKGFRVWSEVGKEEFFHALTPRCGAEPRIMSDPKQTLLA